MQLRCGLRRLHRLRRLRRLPLRRRCCYYLCCVCLLLKRLLLRSCCGRHRPPRGLARLLALPSGTRPRWSEDF